MPSMQALMTAVGLVSLSLAAAYTVLTVVAVLVWRLRRGPDGIDGTEDDTVFQNLNDVRAALSLSEDQFKQLGTLIGFKDPIFRVVSVGQSGNVQRTVQLVFRQTGSTPQLISWKEF